MSILPDIGTGRLVISGHEPEKGQVTNTGNVVRRKKGNKSLLEISQNLQSIHHEDGKRLRSRSYEHSSGDEIENHERKKAKIDRSKSLGRVERKWELKRKEPVGNENNVAGENKMSKSKSPKRSMSGRRVRFDSSSDDSFNKKEGGKSFELKSSTPKPKGVQYKFRGNKNDVAMETSPITSGEVSPTAPRKQSQQGTHKSRLEAARERAKIWKETWSDPGPSERSIENDKVLRGQPVDPRRSRFQTEATRNKNAEYINQDKQDGRPKAADKGRRLQSLPSKKESHASETEDRPVISAPSKDQGQTDAPMPKINTLMSKDDHASSQPGNSTSGEPPPLKSKEPSVSPAKAKESASNHPPQPKEPTDIPRKPKEPAESPRKTKEQVVSQQKRETENKPKETRRVEINVAGVAGRTTMDEDSNRNNKKAGSTGQDRLEGSPTKSKDDKRRLPADDHGPVNPAPKPAPVAKPSNDASDPNFNYYASEKQRAADGGKSYEDSPRVPSEKSSKTDKSWTTIKTKSSFPAAPTKSKTTYEFSQTPSLANSDRKRREVTIVDPKYVKRNNKSDDDDDEPFMHEYEFSHSQIKHHREFRDMTDEEKIEYFRDTLHMKPEQVRELTFHPKVTEPKVIHHTYTGVETVNWTSGRIKSGRRPKSKKLSMYRKVSVVPPSQRKSAMLTKLQGVVYRHINKVYGDSPRDVREKQFFEKLAQVQINDMQHRYEMLAEKERKQLESKYKQREQLRHLRRKFEDDAWRRFMTQYVTSKVVEAEYKDRKEYGLPNDLNEGRRRNPYAVQKTNRKRAQFAMTPKRMQRINQKKYGSIFKYNAGPVPKSGGKPLKFEGFDAVYIDTEDENDPDTTTSGKPMKRRQNVEALMKEARRILDQSDDDTDYEDTPRKSRPARRSMPERPRHNRSRNTKHVPDDKSYKSSQSKQSTVHSKSISKTPPRTMKELVNQRRHSEAPGNRYKASNFNAMKADLLKDSDLLNQNEQLQKPKSELPNFETSSKSDSSRHEVAQTKPQRERTPEKVPEPVTHRMTTPVGSPTPAKSQINTKTVTTTQVTTVKTTTTTDDNETDDKKEWKVKDGNVYLDDMETQMAIQTARDKIVNGSIPSRAPSRASKIIENNLQNGYSSKKTVEKPASRTPSRISFRGNQEQSVPTNLRPPRAPSRSSLFSTDAKTHKPQGRTSRTSMIPVNEDQSQQTSTDNGTNRNVKTETAVTENVVETVNVSNGTSTNITKPNQMKDDTIQPKPVGGSKINIRQESRRNSIISNQQKPPVGGRTSVVGIATSNGRVSPAIEKQRQPPSRRESLVDKQRGTVNRKGSVFDNSSVTNAELAKKTVDNVKQTNGYSSPGSKKTDSDYSVPKTVVAKSVNVSENVIENVTETTNSERFKNKQPVKRESINEPKRSVDHSANDSLTSKKATLSERRPSDENKDKPKQPEKPVNKRDVSKGKKTLAGRRSRSRTPQRKQGISGHGDIRMDRNEYEAKGHDGNRPRRSASKEGGSRSRRRSSSGGRKPSKSRKRSISNERKKSKKGSVTKSRFPDIKKKDDGWKVSARSPTQKVSRSEAVDEYTTERVITPKPAGANQWKDLVEKYLRQPSPKVGRTDDRSLLDSNITDDDDDDDEMDIFKRAQMKYKLSVSKTDDEDSDDD